MSSAPSPEPPSDLIRGPKWRTRTTESRRHTAATITFVLLISVGLVTLWGCAWVLGRFDAPGWVLAAVWAVPAAGTVAWTTIRPSVSGLTDDDDDSWLGYSIRWVLVGELEPRPAPVRVIAAILFGAPLGWVLLLIGLLTISGIV